MVVLVYLNKGDIGNVVKWFVGVVLLMCGENFDVIYVIRRLSCWFDGEEIRFFLF